MAVRRFKCPEFGKTHPAAHGLRVISGGRQAKNANFLWDYLNKNSRYVSESWSFVETLHVAVVLLPADDDPVCIASVVVVMSAQGYVPVFLIK